MNCNKTGCTKPATKKPKITFTAKAGGPRAAAYIGICVCNDHASPDPEDYITDEGWQHLSNSMAAQGLAKPDRDSVRVEFDSIA